MTRFVLTIDAKPNPSDPDGRRRLRMGLKLLLRVFGLRCIECSRHDKAGAKGTPSDLAR